MGILGIKLLKDRKNAKDKTTQTKMEDFGVGGKYEKEEKRCQ